MDKKRFFTACIVTLVLAYGTYFALNTMYPYHPEQIQVGETAELSEVLAGSMSPAQPDGSPTNIGTTEELKAAGKAVPTESEPAMPPEEAAPAEDPAAAVEPTPEPEPLAAAPAPEPEPAPAPAEPAPTPEPAAKPPATVAKAEPAAPTAAKPAPAPAAKGKEPIKPWWSGDIEKELSAVYVGSLANRTALVVMFNGGFATVDSLNKFGKVSNAGGRIGGSWELSPNNRRMAIFAVPKSGRYQISLEPGLTDSSGKSFKKIQQGAVDVQ